MIWAGIIIESWSAPLGSLKEQCTLGFLFLKKTKKPKKKNHRYHWEVCSVTFELYSNTSQ